MRYEIWKKSDLGAMRGRPIEEFYTLDRAMQKAVSLSKGAEEDKRLWNEKTSSYDTVKSPLAFAVVERGDGQSRIRGYGIDNKFYDARDCKRCNNTGNDVNSWQLSCSSCKGASYAPKV